MYEADRHRTEASKPSASAGRYVNTDLERLAVLVDARQVRLVTFLLLRHQRAQLVARVRVTERWAQQQLVVSLKAHTTD